MISLKESILSSTKTGKYSQEGNEIIEDGIPCTVVCIVNDYVTLLSSPYNTKKNEFEKGDILKSEFLCIPYKDVKSLERKLCDNGWHIPRLTGLQELAPGNILFKNCKDNEIVKYTSSNNFNTMWCYSGKDLTGYNIKRNNFMLFSKVENLKIPIRLIKVKKI